MVSIRVGDNRPVATIERPLPPLNADERTTLEAWLDFHRAIVTGLVQHMAEVERNWFRRVFAGERVPPIYDPRADPDDPDGGFDLASDATLGDALATWRAEIARARSYCAGHALADTGRFMDQDVNLRWAAILARWRHGTCAWHRRVLHAG